MRAALRVGNEVGCAHMSCPVLPLAKKSRSVGKTPALDPGSLLGQLSGDLRISARGGNGRNICPVSHRMADDVCKYTCVHVVPAGCLCVVYRLRARIWGLFFSVALSTCSSFPSHFSIGVVLTPPSASFWLWCARPIGSGVDGATER
jgi:hypothetical protein